MQTHLLADASRGRTTKKPCKAPGPSRAQVSPVPTASRAHHPKNLLSGGYRIADPDAQRIKHDNSRFPSSHLNIWPGNQS